MWHAPATLPFLPKCAGDFPDGPRPLSSHQFSPLGDLPCWVFEVLTLGVVVVRGCQKVSGLVVRTDPRAWDRATVEEGKPTVVVMGSPAAFRVTCPSLRRGPEEIEILQCTQRRRSPRATRGGFAHDSGSCSQLSAYHNCGRSGITTECPCLRKFPHPGHENPEKGKGRGFGAVLFASTFQDLLPIIRILAGVLDHSGCLATNSTVLLNSV